MTRRGEVRAAHETLGHRADPEQQIAAAIAVAARARNATDAAELLDALGLLCPPEGPQTPEHGPAGLAVLGLRLKRSQGLSGPPAEGGGSEGEM